MSNPSLLGAVRRTYLWSEPSLRPRDGCCHLYSLVFLKVKCQKSGVCAQQIEPNIINVFLSELRSLTTFFFFWLLSRSCALGRKKKFVRKKRKLCCVYYILVIYKKTCFSDDRRAASPRRAHLLLDIPLIILSHLPCSLLLARARRRHRQ